MAIKRRFSSTQIIVFAFMGVILIGALLLCLPISTEGRVFTPFVDCLFTATSAACVTGLAVEHTASYWSTFGEIVILLLIQIGGLGIMTLLTSIMFFVKKQVGLFNRKLFMQSAGISNAGNIFSVFKRILFGTLIIEGIGAIVLSTVFVPDHGLIGFYYAVFHSVSAFCNAGFDLFSSSLTEYNSNPVVIITVSILIIVGGLGFIVWSNLIDAKLKYKKFNLHTRIVLISTASLIVLPTILYLIFDWNHSLAGMSFGEKLLNSFFQVVSPRTAGFSSIDLTTTSDSSYILVIFLMFIGGSSGSTAGGLKTTTFVVILFSIFAEVTKKDNIIIRNRKLPPSIAKTASAIFAMFISLVIISAMIICALEPTLGVKEIFYEVTSAICTVGLSLGITPYLCTGSKIVLILLMFIGRVGSLSFVLAFGEKKTNPPIDQPTEKIMIG